ncbi:glutamate synthase-related protein [Oceanobacter kriegii]|uniref:glutamate synthase-related protein n=1 Tax=Oceanobacter kriegii TaxID=64972 RepID=UPI00040106BC|nr:glutamate synthase-related protein [Oceanobacter kriegii]
MRTLYNPNQEHSSCGVGFITNKHSQQTHELLELAHQALCKIPHRGGMSSEGIGDGAGVNVDISVNFYRYLTGNDALEYGDFGVANFFYPRNPLLHDEAEQIINKALRDHGLPVLMWRDVLVNGKALNKASQQAQLSIRQVVFSRPQELAEQADFEARINAALLDIEYPAFTRPELAGFYPLSMSSYTQVYKGRLNSWEVIPYFRDLTHPEHHIHTLFFHTRFSTNTAPNPMFAQPFRRMAHNGELNTDKKNRLSEDAIARLKGEEVIFPDGQSDSARLDQTFARRITEDGMDIVHAALAMMPPAWENDADLNDDVRAMLEYFSLSEEKNDGPAALIFGDGIKVGARLDRLGLRPLRTVETHDYFAVMSEAGQIDFNPEDVLRRGRIEAGGMVVFDHRQQRILENDEVLQQLAQAQDYKALLANARINLAELPEQSLEAFQDLCELKVSARHVAYSLNQESFKFMLDPMLQSGMEKISAMGYGLAPNALNAEEGGMSRYFSQRFAQVTNPPLDSIREADGMTLRVALGPKPGFSQSDNPGRQLVIPSPILQPQQLLQIYAQQELRVETIATLFEADSDNPERNRSNLLEALERVCSHAEAAARSRYDVIVLSDQNISMQDAALPAIMVISAVNQRLIRQGLRFNASVVYLTGQAASTHDIACLLGFGAAAVCPLSVYHRAQELAADQAGVQTALNKFQKAVEKALMKTMGKFGLCTAESYIGGEFFEANFIDTADPVLAPVFPNIHSPVGGVQFADIAQSCADWHSRVRSVQQENEIPLLGLFKERAEGAGHAFGTTAVREYVNMTEEAIQYTSPAAQLQNEQPNSEQPEDEPRITPPAETAHLDLGYSARTPEQINQAGITPAYREFQRELYAEREQRPSTLRDVLSLPLDFNSANTAAEFAALLTRYNPRGNLNYSVQGLHTERVADRDWQLTLDNASKDRYAALLSALSDTFGNDVSSIASSKKVPGKHVRANGKAAEYLAMLVYAPSAIALEKVQPAAEITACLASGAMSHGALVARAHEAVAQGTNIAGAMSNSGEGGENSRRYNSVKASKIKQFASGRFGVWTGYLADPSLQEIEIKIAQGAKPGEGGQLPSPKVNVEIAAARGGTPGVELVSPPPHHDTYSIEDLGQLIHDAKAARVRVIVKLVSSEGVGTIAVGVAKAGADVINIAGNTGGTGAAQVTSLKNTGRAADLGIAEVHQALAENGLRDKVVLRCSNAHQTGLDVVKSAILGADSFEFGTTALMMLKCVMAKNCNIKCPAGLTTNAEMYAGDPRALAQYFINIAHDTREVLAQLGFKSLRAVRGQTWLLNLIDHPAMVGQLDMSAMLREVQEIQIAKPVYLEANFEPDDRFLTEFQSLFIDQQRSNIQIAGPKLNNCNKTVGGQFSIDIERLLNYGLDAGQQQAHPAIQKLANGRKVLARDSVTVNTHNSAGQSFAAFNNSGVIMDHSGTCNDGVGKGASGGVIIARDPTPATETLNENVLVGNFALFGATGGELYVQGQAGDRFGVRNSGAIAVVEGVGDFCCEYMTNGSIVNLGGYGKGLGNGMSGGTAYQYDPQHRVAERCSQDSVVAFRLNEDNELARGQEQALRWHLQQHQQRTGSALAQQLLDNWDTARNDFYYLIPRSLLAYHRAEPIRHSMNRKAMIDELASGCAERQLENLKEAYQQPHRKGLFDGRVPTYGDTDSPLMLHMINAAGALRRALECAQKTDPQQADARVPELIEQQDKKLLDALTKDASNALSDYDEDALACLLAHKRLSDYQDSLRRREVWDTQALGTSVWILECQRINRQQLAQFPAFDLKLAQQYASLLAEAARAAAA